MVCFPTVPHLETNFFFLFALILTATTGGGVLSRVFDRSLLPAPSAAGCGFGLFGSAIVTGRDQRGARLRRTASKRIAILDEKSSFHVVIGPGGGANVKMDRRTSPTIILGQSFFSLFNGSSFDLIFFHLTKRQRGLLWLSRGREIIFHL